MSKTGKGIALYLLLSFGGAWTLWLAAALLFDVSPRGPLFQLLLLPGGFAPPRAPSESARGTIRIGPAAPCGCPGVGSK
jgi:hypothetical protein